VIATKFGWKIDPKAQRGSAGRDSQPEHIKEVAEASLKPFKTDVIDLSISTGLTLMRPSKIPQVRSRTCFSKAR
jgi:aryl-alcohol dehydrogenase-like predicted oxidoreductase